MSGCSVHGHTCRVAGLRPEDEETVRRFAAWKRRRRTPGRGDGDTRSPQDVYAELMKKSFGPALREVGLRGSGGRFELPSDVYWAQLGFQKSAYSDGQEIRFTVNLSVILRDEWTQQTEAKPYLGARPTPTNHYGSWADQARIGTRTPEGADKWWRIVRGVASDDVRDDALHDLLTYAVPWLRERVG
jgi:hypothetical protein